MKKFIETYTIYILILLIPVLGEKAWALPLFNTDDAGIVSTHSCQIEFFYRFYTQASPSIMVSPACNIFEQAELSVSFNSDKDEQSYAIQLKRPFFIYNDFSIAASVQFEEQQGRNWHLNIPTSFNLSDKWKIDANIGYNQFNHHPDRMVAIASTYSLNLLNEFSIEFSKINSEDKTAAQFLYHYHLIPEKLSLYTAYAQSLTTDPPISIGFGLSWIHPNF